MTLLARILLSGNNHRRVSFLDSGLFKRTNLAFGRSTTVGYSACDQRVAGKNAKGFSYNQRTMESAKVPFMPLWPYEENNLRAVNTLNSSTPARTTLLYLLAKSTWGNPPGLRGCPIGFAQAMQIGRAPIRNETSRMSSSATSLVLFK